tara:strand:- start:21 stop:803 length:783 start_codon:yes stop_codon:yes gene_type:complete
MLQEIVKFFINPVLQFFILILFLIKQKKPGKVFIAFIFYFYLLSIPMTSILFYAIWSVDDTYDEEKTYDCAVILTGGVDSQWYLKKLENKTSNFQSQNYFMFNNAAERFFKGIDLVILGKVKKIYYGNFIPKSNLSSFDTSELVKRFAFQNGVQNNQFIIYGDEVKNTLDEATQFHINTEDTQLNNILLITSQSHMRRANGLFMKQGTHADLLSVQKSQSLKIEIFILNNFIPSIKGLSSSKRSFYELFGFVGYFLLGKL